jgi:hypothetical protein
MGFMVRRKANLGSRKWSALGCPEWTSDAFTTRSWALSAFSNHLHPDPGRGRIDFVYVSGGTARLVFQEARAHTSPSGFVVRVPSPEHLVAMKVLAMKNDPERTLREMADLHFLLGVPGVDKKEARRQFERHGLLERYLDIERLSR